MGETFLSFIKPINNIVIVVVEDWYLNLLQIYRDDQLIFDPISYVNNGLF